MTEQGRISICANKGISTDQVIPNLDTESTLSDSDGTWRSPSKLKQEVQTIIDIMAPSVSQRFNNYNGASDADNEDSIFSTSKLSSLPQFKDKCDCNNDDSDKTLDISRDDTNLSVIVDTNTKMSDLEDLYSQKPEYICPPPLLPANVCINSECLCPHMATLIHGGALNMAHCYGSERFPREGQSELKFNSCGKDQENVKQCQEVKSSIMNWFKNFVAGHNNKCDKNSCEYYKMNVKRSRKDDKSPPRRVIFELVDDVPKNDEDLKKKVEKKSRKREIETNEMVDRDHYSHQNLQKIPCREHDDPCHFEKDDVTRCESSDLKKSVGRTTYFDANGKTRVDVYYFDHGNSTHFQTTDYPPLVCTEALSEKTEKHATKFWAEIFGTVHIGFSFCTSFILQFFRFLLYSILRPLTIGLVQLASDYFFKPLLATLFNGIVQPVLIFLFNVATSIKDLCQPLAEGVGYFLREFSVLLRAIRVVEINKVQCKNNVDCKCEKIKSGMKNKSTCQC